MAKNNNFCIFIISHGRANSVITWKLLDNKKSIYPRYIIIDNTDTESNEYIKNFGKDKVIIFDKEKIAKITDHGDNFNNLQTTTHARNACYNIAKDLGYTYFLVLDDDYTAFQYRIDNNFKYPNPVKSVSNIDKIIALFLEYYKSIPAKSICMSQGGDYIGGDNGFGTERTNYSRKAMNSWFCSVDRPIKFLSRLNEDVNTYLIYGQKGDIYLTIPFVSLTQKATQKNVGGMSDAYIESGTYVKTFYTVMYCPSFCKVTLMGTTNRRIHHKINWNHAVPKIISPEHKK